MTLYHQRSKNEQELKTIHACPQKCPYIILSAPKHLPASTVGGAKVQFLREIIKYAFIITSLINLCQNERFSSCLFTRLLWMTAPITTTLNSLKVKANHNGSVMQSFPASQDKKA